MVFSQARYKTSRHSKHNVGLEAIQTLHFWKICRAAPQFQSNGTLFAQFPTVMMIALVWLRNHWYNPFSVRFIKSNAGKLLFPHLILLIHVISNLVIFWILSLWMYAKYDLLQWIITKYHDSITEKRINYLFSLAQVFTTPHIHF